MAKKVAVKSKVKPTAKKAKKVVKTTKPVVVKPIKDMKAGTVKALERAAKKFLDKEPSLKNSLESGAPILEAAVKAEDPAEEFKIASMKRTMELIAEAKEIEANEANKKSRAVVIFYHKNIQHIYKQRWIDACIGSIAGQSYQDFDVMELDYGDYPEPPEAMANIKDKKLIYEHKPMENHIDAMNYSLDKAFNELGYDIVLNTNMDDFYHPTRFEKQIQKIEEGFDLVSTDFCYIEENGDSDHIIHHMRICQYGDIKENLDKSHNVIAHPVVAFSKRFWDSGLKYKNLKPYEDMDLWQRAINAGLNFCIIDEELLFYRRHSGQITQEK